LNPPLLPLFSDPAPFFPFPPRLAFLPSRTRAKLGRPFKVGVFSYALSRLHPPHRPCLITFFFSPLSATRLPQLFRYEYVFLVFFFFFLFVVFLVLFLGLEFTRLIDRKECFCLSRGSPQSPLSPPPPTVSPFPYFIFASGDLAVNVTT